MKALVTYLRHGIVYYHASWKKSRWKARAAASMDPSTTCCDYARGIRRGVHHRLGTVTCVSGTYAWDLSQPQTVLVFDMNSRPVGLQAAGNQDSPRVERVGLELQYWAQIAVIE